MRRSIGERRARSIVAGSRRQPPDPPGLQRAEGHWPDRRVRAASSSPSSRPGACSSTVFGRARYLFRGAPAIPDRHGPARAFRGRDRTFPKPGHAPVRRQRFGRPANSRIHESAGLLFGERQGLRSCGVRVAGVFSLADHPVTHVIVSNRLNRYRELADPAGRLKEKGRGSGKASLALFHAVACPS